MRTSLQLVGLRRWLLSGVLLAASLTLAAPATAEGPRHAFRLEVRSSPGTAACGVERELRRALPRLLGYDPFDPGAAQELHVQVFPMPPGELAAYIEHRDQDGNALWFRLYRRPAGDCAGLVDSLMLGLEVELSGEEAPPALPPPAPCPPREACPPCSKQDCPPERAPAVKPKPKPKPKPPAAPTTTAWSMSMGAETLLGPLPAITGAGTLGVALRAGFLTVGLEGRASGPAVVEIPTRGTILTFMLTGSMVPCLRGWAFEACAVGSLGTLRALGRGVDVPEAETLFYAAAGLRAAVLVPVSERFFLRPYVEIAFPVTEHTLALQRREVWIAPSAGAILGVSTAMSLTAP